MERATEEKKGGAVKGSRIVCGITELLAKFCRAFRVLDDIVEDVRKIPSLSSSTRSK